MFYQNGNTPIGTYSIIHIEDLPEGLPPKFMLKTAMLICTFLPGFGDRSNWIPNYLNSLSLSYFNCEIRIIMTSTILL